MSVLVFGLTRYYSTLHSDNNHTVHIDSTSKSHQNFYHSVSYKKANRTSLTVAFVTIFALLIIVSSFSNKQDFHVFTNWKDISVLDLIQLGAAVALCFFIPGFAIVLVITKKYNFNPLLSVLLGYLFSMLITGVTAYISTLIFDIATSDSKGLFISVYVGIIAFFLIFYPERSIKQFSVLRTRNYFDYRFIVIGIIKFCQHLKTRANEYIVFGSLISLIIILTYYLYGGVTIGDQWYHQGRTLLFMSGAFREASMTGADEFYPPFQSALLAALTVLSGIPLVNSYASIAIVNIVPVFAYLYFFSMWVPTTMRKAGLLACSLLTIGAGFGWIYLLTSTSSHIFSVQSSLETLRNIGHLDIISATNFVMATAPDFSTGLIYIALPAGFVLLGIIREYFQRTSLWIAVIAAISVLGLMSHYEFYIFIIIASILPLIFKIRGGNYIYLSFCLAFFIVYLIDVTSPGSYLSSLKINGIPLLLLAILFVAISWTIYLGYSRLHRALESISSLFLKIKFQHRVLRLNFHAGILIISLVVYFYLFSFIVLSQLPLDTIIDHTLNNSVPWYLYPMKMGTAGLFGLAFILSYIFKRFEKQVFVFGALMLVSFIAGPYYNEERFAKYFMTGMIGFASLMIYDLLMHKFTNKNAIRTVLVSAIIITSGLSVLAFIGYSSLILQAEDYTDTLPRRHFPSDSDLRLFEMLHNKFDVNSRYNVITFLNEYNRAEDGLISKIASFAGLPYSKLHQSPLTLNASTLEALYHHLQYSNSRYLLLPNDFINRSKMLTEPTRFVTEHFTPIYQDDNYIVLQVPSLEPPSSSSKSKVALVNDQGNNLTEGRLFDAVLLPYNSKTFDFKSNNMTNIQKHNQTEHLNLSGSRLDRGVSVWTKNITPAKGANYIETGFQITSENENKSNDVRVEWQEAGMWDYYVKLSNDGLELYKKLDTNKKILLKNTELDKVKWKWYALKIESLPDSINIYMDNVLKIQAPKNTGNNSAGISKIGLTTFYNDVKFTPVKLATVSQPSHTYEVVSDYDHNYPISLLALSRLSYDTFNSNDLSMFDNDAIFVPDSVLSDNVTINRYLNYVSGGGALIIINSHGNFSSIAGKVFSLKSNESNQEAFTHISGNTNQNVSINVPGRVNRTNAVTLPDVQVIASYRNYKNESIAPFILEKTFPTGGKILLLNSEGYFNTLSNFPRQYFSGLSNISSLLPIDLAKPAAFQNTALPTQGFVGKMKISGMVTLNSSSLLLNSFPINTSRIIIFNNNSNLPELYNNASVKDLKLIGDYQLNINFTGQSELPDASSYLDYIGIKIPNEFNMSVNLGPKSSGYIETVDKGGAVTEFVKLNNNSKIGFYKTKVGNPLNSVSVLVKKPEIKVNGHVYINNAYLNGYLTGRGKLDVGTPLDIDGQLVAKFAFVDNFNQPYLNATKTQYITYLQSLAMDGRLNQDKEKLPLPGDIYFKANEKLPLRKIFISPINIIVLAGLIIAVILASKFLRKKNLQV